uniref:NF-kappa-B-activating protein C-terminal domain-containing protein n=1 Tax=Ditylenchus dipsaci TaxID=166011 RepID=A0A915CUV3_9BILA
MAEQEGMEVEQCSSDIEDGITQNPEKNFVDTDYKLKFHSDSNSDSDREIQEKPAATIDPKLEPNGSHESPKNGHYEQEFRKRRRSRSRSKDRKDNFSQHKHSRRRDPDSADEEKNNARQLSNLQAKTAKEDEYWRSRRHDREKIGGRGSRSVWGYSPSHTELEEVFELHDSVEKKAAIDLKKEGFPGSDDKNKDSKKKNAKETVLWKRRHKKKKKKHKKEHSKKHLKKVKKQRRHSKSKSEEKEEEWVELTKELRDKEAKKAKDEESLVIGPQIPEHLLHQSDSPTYEGKLAAEDRKNMLRGEAAAMAAYAAQGKRIPRRGEIGLSSEEISVYEKVGYVMSGTRHKSMEATRLRKENQILTAEEKRLLNTFSQEERKKREDTVLKQFQELISRPFSWVGGTAISLVSCTIMTWVDESKDVWENVLYKKSKFPDNFSDETQFLCKLKKNVSVVHYSIWKSVVGASNVMCQIDIVVIYLLIFEFIQMKYLEVDQLMVIVAGFATLCASVYLTLNRQCFTTDVIADHFRTLVTLLLFGYGFTPLIRTLTTSISTDTIYATSFFLFFLSLIFHDYGMDAPIVSTPFSVNLSFAASVFLISRVDTDQLAFYLMAFSMCAFSFWPRVRKPLFEMYTNCVPLILLLILCPATILLLVKGIESIPLAVIHECRKAKTLFMVLGMKQR